MSENLSHEEKVSVVFQPLQIGSLKLKNRVVMAPMTRSRATSDKNVVQDMTVTYYAQRATAGLIITEATQVTPQGIGYINTPGIHSEEQVKAWKKVTDAVHEKDGLIFAQLWHVGRMSHSSFHNGELPVAPSAIGYDGQVYTTKGFEKVETPRALTTEEVKGVVEKFRQGAANAKEAGFDGVEIHGANGYLIDQFLRDGSNHRTDEYGGNIENRVRFLLEITNAAIEVWGADKVGVRLSPSGIGNGMDDSDPAKLFTHAIQELDKLPLAYLHLMEPFFQDPSNPKIIDPVLDYFRPYYSGNIIINKGYTLDKAADVISEHKAELVSFGVPFIANPDLVERFKHDYPLAQPDQTTMYGGNEKGYIDYPNYNESAK